LIRRTETEPMRPGCQESACAPCGASSTSTGKIWRPNKQACKLLYDSTANLRGVTEKKDSGMSESLLFRKVFHALESAISISSRRYHGIAGNISNLDTSNDKPRDRDFKAAPARAIETERQISLSRTHPGHMEVVMNPEVPVQLFEEEGKWNRCNWVYR